MIPFAYLAFEELDASTLNVLTAPLEQPAAIRNLMDGISYDLVSYAPTVAPLRENGIAGGGGYADVQDTLVINVLGDTPGACVDAYDQLMQVFDQARRWEDGENVNPWQIAASVQQSTVGKLSAVILGAAPGQPPATTSPEPTVIAPGVSRWIIRNVQVSFIRRPLWLGPRFDAEDSDTVVSADNPTVEILSFTADQGETAAPAVVKVQTAVSATLLQDETYLFIAGRNRNPLDSSGAAQIGILDATDLAAGAPGSYSLVNNSANRPYQGTNVLRYTPASTAAVTSGAVQIQTWDVPPDAGRLMALFAVVRNNSAIDFLVAPDLFQVSGDGSVRISGRAVPVAAGSTDPRIVPLGILPYAGGGVSSLALTIQALSITGPPTLDISHLVAIHLDAQPATVIRLQSPAGIVDVDLLAVRAADRMANRGPLVLYNATAGVDVLDFPDVAYGTAFAEPVRDGDAEIASVGQYLAVCCLSTDGANWTISDGAAKADLTFNASRRRAYRVVQ